MYYGVFNLISPSFILISLSFILISLSFSVGQLRERHTARKRSITGKPIWEEAAVRNRMVHTGSSSLIFLHLFLFIYSCSFTLLHLYFFISSFSFLPLIILLPFCQVGVTVDELAVAATNHGEAQSSELEVLHRDLIPLFLLFIPVSFLFYFRFIFG